MTPVYQTIYDNKRGNCLAAITASLLNLRLNEVPSFIRYKDWLSRLEGFMILNKRKWGKCIINGNRELTDYDRQTYELFKDQLPDEGHFDGYYDATVFSPKYFNEELYFNLETYIPTYHAVICDKQFNIVHDPNLKYNGIKYPLADRIGYNGIVGVGLWNKIQ